MLLLNIVGKEEIATLFCAEPHSSVSNKRLLVQSPALPIFFPRMGGSHCNRIHSSFAAVCCFNNGYVYVGKQPAAWKELKDCRKAWMGELPAAI